MEALQISLVVGRENVLLLTLYLTMIYKIRANTIASDMG